MDFYWRECVTGDHVGAAVQKLMACVREQSGADTNAYVDADNQDAFRRRIVRATRGQLIPTEHVKAIASVPTADMFEIRWSDITAFVRDPVSGLIGHDLTLHVRLYYIEEGQPWVVGLHAHVKELCDDDEETLRLQNGEIAKAERHAVEGAPRRWGVPELERP